jgi:hypothetical protein
MRFAHTRMTTSKSGGVKVHHPGPSLAPVAMRHQSRFPLGLPWGWASAPNSLDRSWRARCLRTRAPSKVICTVSPTKQTPSTGGPKPRGRQASLQLSQGEHRRSKLPPTQTARTVLS